MKHDRFLGRLIASYIEPAVVEVRQELAKNYNVEKGPERNYCGLCDEAIALLDEKIHDIDHVLKKSSEANMITLHVMHGEQKHYPRVRHEYWALQHTWCCLSIWHNDNHYMLYVDPTSSQFSNIYYDIPNYYIARKPPKWFLSDRKNARFNGITKWIEDRIVFTIKVNTTTPKGKMQYWHRYGLIEFLQYEIWGRISDILFWIFTYSTYYKY